LCASRSLELAQEHKGHVVAWHVKAWHVQLLGLLLMLCLLLLLLHCRRLLLRSHLPDLLRGPPFWPFFEHNGTSQALSDMNCAGWVRLDCLQPKQLDALLLKTQIAGEPPRHRSGGRHTHARYL
jgi:hypothetical protein